MRKKIIYAVLDWGLGHATRSIPVIKTLSKKYEIIIVSDGRSLKFLQNEFCENKFYEVKGYNIRYAKNKGMVLPVLILQTPKIVSGFVREYYSLKRIIKKEKPVAVVSDNRYGFFSRKIPSFFITHQLRFKLSKSLSFLEPFTELYNKFILKRFKKIFVPDNEGNVNLSGELSHNLKRIDKSKLKFVGPLADVSYEEKNKDIDWLFSVTGPEPSRTIFEEAVLSSVSKLNGRKVVVLGRPETKTYEKDGDVEIYSFADRNLMKELLLRSKFVICRSGYSTVMELAVLNAKALFIPTPGQTEQEYLGKYYMNNDLFYSVPQDELDLVNDCKKAEKFYSSKRSKFEQQNLDKVILEEIEKFI